MKLISILILFLISSCTPMDVKIQKAISETRTVEATMFPTSTETPENTSTPTPTKTLRPTTTPKTLYILDTGVCPLKADENNTPQKEGCMVEETQNIDVRRNKEIDFIEITIQNGDPTLFNYCALYDLDGKLLDFQIDFDHTGKLACSPN